MYNIPSPAAVSLSVSSGVIWGFLLLHVNFLGILAV